MFDLSQEKDELRDRYGRNTFGQSCLVARRLVERGVPYVTINYKGWDTHKQHFQTMRRKLPEMDKGMATLLQDLADRGLLDSTIVWWSGEFGRTPQGPVGSRPGTADAAIRARSSRRWSPAADSRAATWSAPRTPRAKRSRTGPSIPCDLIGSMYELLGIDPDGKLPHPQGLDVRVTPTAADGVHDGRTTEGNHVRRATV